MKMLTKREVADRIGIAPSSVCRLMSEGRLPGAKIAGQWRVDASVLEEFLLKAQQAPPPPKVDMSRIALRSNPATNPFL